MMPKNILITGITGFVGFNLAKALVSQGFNVSAIIRAESSLENIKSIIDDVNLVSYDGKIASMVSLVADVKPDCVIHLASNFLSSHEPDDIKPIIESNVLFGTQLVEAMVQNKVHNFINTGTSWQYYGGNEYNPVNLYAATKQAFESILKYYIEAKALRVTNLYLSDTYGYGDWRKKLFWILKNTETTGEELAMSAGEQLIDMVHIDDVASAFIRAINITDEQYNGIDASFSVSSDNLIALKDLVAIYQDVHNVKLNIAWGKKPYREREVMTPWQGKLLPGWSPKILLKEGMNSLKEGS